MGCGVVIMLENTKFDWDGQRMELLDSIPRKKELVIPWLELMLDLDYIQGEYTREPHKLFV